jgi:hypothetical protein
MRMPGLLRALCAREVHNSSLLVGGVTLGMLFLSVPALAQNSDPHSMSLPNAPSETRSTPDVVDHSLTFGQRTRLYGHTVFSPGTILGPAIGAGIGQWENEPPEWHQGAEGYGRRIGSGIAKDVISKTITFGVAAVDREDPRYLRSEDRSVWGRTKNAVAWGFVSPTASGRRIPAFSKWIGIYGAAFIANTWYPEFPQNRATAGNAAVRGTTSLGSSIAWKLARSFMPFRHDDNGKGFER